ncbi:MAG TPA: hypothetical protein VIJ09_14540 [Acidimicrobiales bacterium]
MRVIDRQGNREDEHFTEGEPDLEPPEELAVAEVDEESHLEEDLDRRADLEDEVDVDALEISLDHLVHDGEEEEDESESAALGDLEIEDLEDREESLDLILRSKLAGDEEPAPVDDDEVDEAVMSPGAGAATRAEGSWGEGEFLCRSCFLVRSASQRVGTSGSLCHACSD